jgi:hypothetical protein
MYILIIYQYVIYKIMPRKNCDYNYTELLFCLCLTDLRPTKNSILNLSYDRLKQEGIIVSYNSYYLAHNIKMPTYHLENYHH